MANPLYNQIGNPMMQRFQQFKNQFHGDPQQQVQQLLNSRRVTQEQYNKAVQIANQLRFLIGM